VRLTDAADASAGHALVLIDRETPGLHVERGFSSADGSGHVQLRLESAQVPADQLLGATAPSAAGALSGLTGIRLSVAARATGAALWALDTTRARLLEPHRDGVPLGSREGVRLRLADMALALYAARAALYRTARLAARGNDVREAVMAAKVLCTESAVAVVDRALLLAGATALTTGHPLERLQRELRASDVLRVSLGKAIVERGVGEP
jgi:alkylation response protein AidB-like acyl-CoA dehydrogenase